MMASSSLRQHGCLVLLSVTVSLFVALPAVDCFHFAAISLEKAATSKTMLGMYPFDNNQASPSGDKLRRNMEFLNLEPLPESQTRKARIALDLETKAQFAKYGDELWELRNTMKDLMEKLAKSMRGESKERENLIRDRLMSVEQRDPELVYELEMLEMELAQREKDYDQVEESRERAQAARSCLPQFNLEGLWVGKYGNHGYEMINVTYVGDTMIAFKVTGDKNVPRGEISFQADLTPIQLKKFKGGKRSSAADIPGPLEPIKLTEKASQKWGTTQLPRYRGMGQVAEEVFGNNRWVDGQLIIIGDEYFSFAWVPLETQIFFGRPSPELALKMLREGGMEGIRGKSHWDAPPSMDDDVSVLKDYVASCLDKTTETIEDELQGDAFGCIWHGHSQECYFE